MPLLHGKTEQQNYTLERKPIIQRAERPVLKPPKIAIHHKIKFQAPVIQKPIFPDKSVKHVDPVIKPIVKQVISQITPYHVKQVPGTEHVSARSKQQKPAYADQNCRLPQKQIKTPTQVHQRETEY